MGYARRALRSTLDVCSSCHAQLTETANQVWKFDENLLKGTSFQRAEFLFATRQYGPALTLYRNFARNYSADQDPMELELALTRILAIDVRLVRNPKAARDELELVKKNSAYSSSLKTKIDRWIREIKRVEAISPPNIEKISAPDLVKFCAKHLSLEDAKDFSDNPKLVQALYLSGLLYQFIATRPKKDLNADVLYWLALYETRLGENYPVELSRLYLKECVLQFSADPAAKKCFKEYESMQLLDYTGSAGTDLPPDVKKELEMLKAKVEPAKTEKTLNPSEHKKK